MNNRKPLLIITLLLFMPSVFAQEAPPPFAADQRINRNVHPQPQPQPQPQLLNENIPPGSTSHPVFATFDGIVVQADPMEVKSVNGEVRTFLPPRQEASPQLLSAWPKSGDLVSLTYEPDAKGNRLKEIRIVGTTIIGTIKEIASDLSWLIVRTRLPDKPENEVNVPLQASNQFQPLVSAMRSGDGIKATYIRSKGLEALDGVNSVKSLEWQSKPVGRSVRWFSLIGALVLLWVIAFVFTRGRPAELFLGEDNRYSSSKFQTVLWFSLVISAYIAIVSHRIAAAGWSYVGGVDIPQNLLILSGISVLTFTAAKAITSGKIEGKPDLKGPATAPKATDLISTDDNKTDLGDFQMVAITILAVIIYAISAVEFMEQIEFRRVVTMPDVDATLLSIFGLGQAAYLGKKAAGEQ
jgi:hypothetical protein